MVCEGSSRCETGLSKRRRNVLKLAGSAGAMGLLAGCTRILDNDDEATASGGEDIPEMDITIAHHLPEDPAAEWHRSALSFKNYLEHQSDGQISVELSGGGELGGAAELLEQTMEGTIEVVCGGAEATIAPYYPDFNVITVPYLIQNVEVGNYIFDHWFGAELYEGLRQETGVNMLSSWQNSGLRHFTTGGGNPIESPSDFEGLSFRTQPIESQIEFIEQLGASAEPVDPAELYTSLDQGVVDGQENPIPVIDLLNLNEVQDFLLLDGHFYTQTHLLGNDEWLQSLPGAAQVLVTEASYVASLSGRQASRLGEQRVLSQIEDSMEIYDPPQSMIDELAEMTQDPVEEVVRDLVDDESIVDDFYQAHEEAQQALGFN